MQHAGIARTSLIVALALLVPAGLATPQEEEAPRGWIGVQVRDLHEGEAEELGFDRDGGVLIERVVPEGPAARAGLQSGDILIWVREVRLANLASLETLTSVDPSVVTR